MILSNNTILITGGATGIGLALAEEFLSHDNEVIICGRREEKLREAKEKNPKLHTIQCDLSKANERIKFTNSVLHDFPNLNILINNAGIQQYLKFLGEIPEQKIENEISTNITAPIHLSSLFIPHLLKMKESAIMNVTSGLAFVPIANAPVYCATKAALHSFTMTLRVQLRDTPIKVFELAPPIVDTELDRGERDKHNVADRGISAEECASEMIKMIGEDTLFAPVERAKNMFNASRSDQFDMFFKRMNRLD